MSYHTNYYQHITLPLSSQPAHYVSSPLQLSITTAQLLLDSASSISIHCWYRERRVVYIRDRERVWYNAAKADDKTRVEQRKYAPSRPALKRAQLFRFTRCNFHSAFVTRINNSSSFTGIQLVSAFIAFSKSLSINISLVPSIRAALVACSTSRPPLNGRSFVGVEVRSESPRSMKTSQTRSWAGKGME